MDINGAKALKERLGLAGAGEAEPAERQAVPADAPPVYHWTGKKPAEAAGEGEDESSPRAASLFSRLALGLR